MTDVRLLDSMLNDCRFLNSSRNPLLSMRILGSFVVSLVLLLRWLSIVVGCVKENLV